MATASITFNDRPDGVGYDVTATFDPPINLDDDLTDAQEAALNIVERLSRIASKLTATDADDVVHQVI